MADVQTGLSSESRSFMAAREMADFCDLVVQTVQSEVLRKDLTECDKEIRDALNRFQSTKQPLRAWATRYAEKENLDLFTKSNDAVQDGLKRWFRAVSDEREVQVVLRKVDEKLGPEPSKSRSKYLPLKRFSKIHADNLRSNADVLGSLCRLWMEVMEGAKEQPLKDGPCPPYSWQHNGKVINQELQPMTWDLLDFLWKKPGREAEFDEIAEPVFKDHDANYLGDRVGKQRSLANLFFKKHGLPWKVVANPSRHRVCLEPTSS